MKSSACDICSRSFTRFKSLQNHMKTHEKSLKIVRKSMPLILSDELIVSSSHPESERQAFTSIPEHKPDVQIDN
jgi:hypothetical protein